MKAADLFEEPVESSWVADISYRDQSSTVIMTLHDGRQYIINNVPLATFEHWENADSIGNFFKTYIEGKFVLKRARKTVKKPNDQENRNKPEEKEEQNQG